MLGPADDRSTVVSELRPLWSYRQVLVRVFETQGVWGSVCSAGLILIRTTNTKS